MTVYPLGPEQGPQAPSAKECPLCGKSRSPHAQEPLVCLCLKGTLPRNLLIMSCGARKAPDPNPIPALYRYTGPSYGVLKNFLKARPAQGANLAIWILSAKYGLIPAAQPILDYDQKMTWDRAYELRPATVDKLEEVVHLLHPLQVRFQLSMVYMDALHGSMAFAWNSTPSHASGGMGTRLAQLKTWLYDILPSLSYISRTAVEAVTASNRAFGEAAQALEIASGDYSPSASPEQVAQFQAALEEATLPERKRPEGTWK